MFSAAIAEVDLVEEFRLRRWARENYVPSDLRVRSWHPVILDEMLRKDEEIEPEEVLVGSLAR